MSATDEERLPPGGFSLRDLGVEGWFGRGGKQSAAVQTPRRHGVGSPASGTGSSAASPTPGLRSGGSIGDRRSGATISTYEVLRYIRSTFDNERVLDRIPLSAAGNPGAWHAWRAHRMKSGAITVAISPTSSGKEKSNWYEGLSDVDNDSSNWGGLEGYSRLAGGASAPAATRRPGEWNWDGVWEIRVKKGIDASISEAVLYGKEAGPLFFAIS